MAKEPNVQGDASQQGAPQGEGTNTQNAEQPLTAELLTKALGDFKKEIERSNQSWKDRMLNEVKRTSTAMPTINADILSALDPQSLDGLPPELATEVLKAQARASKEAQNRAYQANQATAFDQKFTQQMQALAKAMEIKPDDERIDWAADAPDYMVRMARIQESIAKAHQGDLEKKVADRIKEQELKQRQAQGLESHNTSGGGGIPPQPSDAEFLVKFGNGELPYTKENKTKAERLIASDEKLV